MGGRGRGKSKRNNNTSAAAAALPPDQKKTQEDASRQKSSLPLKSIVFNLDSFTDNMDHWFMVGHDESSGGRPFLSQLFVLPPLYRIPAAAGVFGSRLYYFPCHPGSYDNILYLDLKKEKSEEEEDCWLDSGLKLPTLCNCFNPGMFGDWLYLMGFNIHCSDPHQKYGCDVSRDKSVWGHVYNIKDGSQYSVQPPSSSPNYDPTDPPEPLVLGPWNDEGLLVYIKQDNTLRLHNPEKDEWRTLACDTTREENQCLKQSTMYLCGDVLYRFYYYSLVVEAYNIRENKRLQRVKFDREKDFPFPQLKYPELCVLAHGVLCFFTFFGGHFYYLSFVVDFDCVDKPKPPRLLQSDVMLCDCGHMQHNFGVEATVLPNLEPFSPPN